MQDSVRETFVELIKKYGTSLVDDPRRLEGLLRDLCGENKREINALIGALKLRVPADLLNTSNVPLETLSVRLIKRIEDDLGMKEELARWAVSAWMAALLGIKIRVSAIAPVEVQTGVRPKSVADKPTYISSLSLIMVQVPGAVKFPIKEDDSGSCEEVNYPYEMGKTQVTYEQWKKVYNWVLKRGYTFSNPGQPGTYKSGHADHPVVGISWRDCIVWCNALTEYYNVMEGTNCSCVYRYGDDIVRSAMDEETCDNVEADPDSKGFRLPTSMEWELVARYIDGNCWTPGNYASGAAKDTDIKSATGEIAWYAENSGNTTHPMGTKKMNALGIYDMSGNA